VGRRRPANSLSIDFYPPSAGSLTSALVDGAFRTVIEAWQPDNAAVRDPATVRASKGRGGYAAVLGYRTWIAPSWGTVSRVDPGLSLEESAEGALLTAPDDWTAEQLVSRLLVSCARNSSGKL